MEVNAMMLRKTEMERTRLMGQILVFNFSVYFTPAHASNNY
jgi:hypothetical protein